MLGRTRASVLNAYERLLTDRTWTPGKFVVQLCQRRHHRMEWFSIGPVKVADGPRDGKVVGFVVSARRHYVMVTKR